MENFIFCAVHTIQRGEHFIPFPFNINTRVSVISVSYGNFRKFHRKPAR